MGAREFPYPHRSAQPLGMLRLQLAPDLERAPMAGMWWPYSRDLTREAAHLVDQFPSTRGRIDRLVYAPGDWEVVANEVYTQHGRIKVGFLPEDRAGGVMLVRLVGSGIIQLRVTWGAPPAPWKPGLGLR